MPALIEVSTGLVSLLWTNRIPNSFKLNAAPDSELRTYTAWLRVEGLSRQLLLARTGQGGGGSETPCSHACGCVSSRGCLPRSRTRKSYRESFSGSRCVRRGFDRGQHFESHPDEHFQ